ncbi:MAG TPA: hypothetical protein VNT56_07925 [Acidimicrobiales bacterium]|jgi:hypothetical protein|nr:hypothetical protein [Acidimicrobiales bacterium]
MNDSAEGAVRLYLMYLEDPTKLVDETAVKKAQDAVNSAKDPLDRLQALAALDRARQADGEQLRKDFVAQASAYAEAQGIPASAFREMGVPADVLAEAGFDGGRRRRRSSSASGRARAPRVPLEDIKAAVSRLSKRFTLAELADAAGGGSPATLRKAVDELISAGKLTKLGPKEDHQGRGRAPTVYQKS